MVFPLFKLGILFIKTIVKPISGGLKNYASHSPYFHSSCRWIANSYHNNYSFLAKSLRIKYQHTPLTDQQALKLGTNLLGEGIVFGAASGILYYEWHRGQRNKAEQKEISADQDDLEQELINLKLRVNKLEVTNSNHTQRN